MKILYFSIFIFIQSVLHAQVYPGITVDEFNKQLPGILPQKIYYNEDLSFTEGLQNFNGQWFFDFQKDTLIDLFYSDNLSKNPQSYTLRDFNFLVEDYSSVFGNPFDVFIKDTAIDANRKRTNIVDTLIQYSWHANKSDFIMGIYFTGNYSVNNEPTDMVRQINAPPQMDYYIFKIKCIATDKIIENTGWNIFVGMTISDLFAVLPDFFPNGIGVTGQWSEEKLYFNIKGNKTYNFENGILTYAIWNYYSGNASKTEFDKCSNGYAKLKKEFVSKYGNPLSVEELPKTEYNSVIKNMKMFTIGKTVWQQNDSRIELRFEKFSGKNDNYYILEIKEEQIKY